MSAATTSHNTYRLVTVNTAPERAKRLIGRVAESLKESYIIDHVANCEAIDEVAPTVTRFQPDVIFAASMWTSEQADEIFASARKVKPDIRIHAIPHGLQVERGPDAIVEHLLETVPKVLS